MGERSQVHLAGGAYTKGPAMTTRHIQQAREPQPVEMVDPRLPEGDDSSPVVEIELTDLAYGGDAVGRHEGRAVFVTGGLPGELVRAQFTRIRNNYAHATLLEVLHPSPNRIVPRYPELGESGGFQWQHLAYPAQLQWKTRIVRQLLMRVGRFATPRVHPTFGMPTGTDPWRYRTVAQFGIGDDGAIGFRRSNTRTVLDMPYCPLVHPVLEDFYQGVRSWMRAHWGSSAGNYVARFTLRCAGVAPAATAGRPDRTDICRRAVRITDHGSLSRKRTRCRRPGVRNWRGDSGGGARAKPG